MRVLNVGKTPRIPDNKDDGTRENEIMFTLKVKLLLFEEDWGYRYFFLKRGMADCNGGNKFFLVHHVLCNREQSSESIGVIKTK